MLCSGRILALSQPTKPSISLNHRTSTCRLSHRKLHFPPRWRFMASTISDSDPSSFPPPSSVDSDSSDRNNSVFCIIEGPETVQDFAKMEMQEIQDNIRSRRNKIFLHMEEVRRLRIQQRIKSAELGILNSEQENELPNFPSFIPFLPPLSSTNLKQYYATCFSLIAGIMLFGGLLAPTLELKLGLGGTSYEDFIRSMHLPMQLSQVDPIVASFSGGAVGVISALMVVEINNVKQQEHKRCKYCVGTGYLACARCSSTGSLVLIEPISTVNAGDQPLSPPKTERCSNCSGAGKEEPYLEVMPDEHIKTGHFFATNGPFSNREELISWIVYIGRKHMIFVMIQHSISANGFGQGRVWIGCERSGRYRRSSDILVDVESHKFTGTKKFHCPFLLQGIEQSNGYWMLLVKNGKHNHFLGRHPQGQSSTGRLRQSEFQILATLIKSPVQPMKIVDHFQKED